MDSWLELQLDSDSQYIIGQCEQLHCGKGGVSGDLVCRGKDKELRVNFVLCYYGWIKILETTQNPACKPLAHCKSPKLVDKITRSILLGLVQRHGIDFKRRNGNIQNKKFRRSCQLLNCPGKRKILRILYLHVCVKLFEPVPSNIFQDFCVKCIRNGLAFTEHLQTRFSPVKAK
jgi:hypothetical protein